MEDVLERIAAKYAVPVDLLKRLIDVEKPKVYLEKRRNVGRDLRREIERCVEEKQQ